jgi:hypothetical protein
MAVAAEEILAREPVVMAVFDGVDLVAVGQGSVPPHGCGPREGRAS